MSDVAVGLSARSLPDMFSHDIPEFLGRRDISDETQKAILHDNPINFYRLKI